MSFVARWFKRLRHPTGFIGRDLEGNRFFEYPSTSDDPRRTKRVVKYAKGAHMLDYVSGQRRLPVQWTSWMTHTRSHPPTLQDLQADLERQQRILQNVAMIEARDRAAAEQIAAQQVPTPHIQAPPRRTSMPGPTEQQETATPVPGMAKTASVESPVGQPQILDVPPWKAPPPDEPHSWQPKSSVRRGG